ncbi:hypothetical protein [Sphingomicrobium sediminis]|uniref:Uncharacterized protein n=1 Tax=Sphingomicrobium sediminis TaxID=2950949 RepID=A0A9X2EIL3_9SPHN|nr:hypothetical protein [Sphingomicrobium sediminis]MCM8557446.1 hypothetical protein [Sphingomicrobium sediminis]
MKIATKLAASAAALLALPTIAVAATSPFSQPASTSTSSVQSSSCFSSETGFFTYIFRLQRNAQSIADECGET